MPLSLRFNKYIFKTGDTFGTTVNSANIISFLLVLFLIFFKKSGKWSN